MVTQSRLREAVEYNPITGDFINRQTGNIIRRKSDEGYIVFDIDGKYYRAHRLAWLYVYGYWPNIIDHKDRDKTNNAIDNLRDVDRQINNTNRPKMKSNTSGIPGVYLCNRTNKWKAFVQRNKKRHYCGVFTTIEEAVASRDELAKELDAEGNFSHQ